MLLVYRWLTSCLMSGVRIGWGMLHHMIRSSLQGQENARRAIQDIRGSHRFVLDYLLEEVLNQQPKEIQEFLLQTAVLKQLTAGTGG